MAEEDSDTKPRTTIGDAVVVQLPKANAKAAEMNGKMAEMQASIAASQTKAQQQLQDAFNPPVAGPKAPQISESQRYKYMYLHERGNNIAMKLEFYNSEYKRTLGEQHTTGQEMLKFLRELSEEYGVDFLHDYAIDGEGNIILKSNPKR